MSKQFVLVRTGSAQSSGEYMHRKTATRIGLQKFGVGEFEVLTQAEFTERGNEKVTVKNIMSGKDIEIDRRIHGTCCDPSTETYWSM